MSEKKTQHFISVIHNKSDEGEFSNQLFKIKMIQMTDLWTNFLASQDRS